MSHIEDRIELVDKIKNKDGEAFRVFVDYYKDYIIRICYQFVHNEDDANDLSQDVFSRNKVR